MNNNDKSNNTNSMDSMADDKNKEDSQDLNEKDQDTKKAKKHGKNKENKKTANENEQETKSDSNEKEDKNNSRDEEELLTKYHRLAADFQNYKRRTDEEKLKTYSNATADFAEKIIPVLDNLERALEHKNEDTDETILSGVEMIYKSLKDVLIEKGVEEIICEGLTLDPNLHHAVNKIKKDDVEPETILEVLQKGYKLKERVIRPAMVVVSE